MSLEAYARNELQRAGLFDKDSDYGGALAEAVMKMTKVFADEDHSGGSARLAIALFKRVASFNPITPLTGHDDEWFEVGEQNGKPLYQNCRCSHIFKEGDRAYDIDAADPRATITFPHEVTA